MASTGVSASGLEGTLLKKSAAIEWFSQRVVQARLPSLKRGETLPAPRLRLEHMLAAIDCDVRAGNEPGVL
jgi:hypothetical protein